MSAIDQAFIRAYQSDETALQAAAPKSAGATAGPHVHIHRPSAAASLGDDASERRPLSAYVQPAQTVDARFKPSLEVDAFRWSAVCDEIVARHAARLRPVLDALLSADDAGRSLIGVGAAAAGVGATTLVGCLARLLTDAGKSVAIVDADFSSPGLAASLGLAVEIGWEDVLAGRVPLAECAVQSIGDRVIVVPLVQGGAPAAEKLDAIHASVTAGVLRYHYDMVLFDLGTVADPVQGAIARRVVGQCRLDALLLAVGGEPPAGSLPQQLLQSTPELAAICLGVVENQFHAVA